jgi:hypothetical protein
MGINHEGAKGTKKRGKVFVGRMGVGLGDDVKGKAVAGWGNRGGRDRAGDRRAVEEVV